MAKSATRNVIPPSSGANWSLWLLPLLVLVLGIAVERTIALAQERSQLEHERSHVVDRLSQLRARLESNITGNLLLIEGLAAVIAAQPDIDQTGFARIARGLVDEKRALRNIAGAPGMVVSLMYPMRGNEDALGLDYRTHPTQRAAAMRAVENGGTIVAGPLRLVQGGTAIIARKPVLLGNGDDPRLWGLVSAVIDTDRLYRLAGLPMEPQGFDLDLAIRGRDGSGAEGETFFGNPSVFARDSVKVDISLPYGSWQMAALPRGGWGTHQDPLSPVRLVAFLTTLILAGMAFLLARNHQRLQTTTRDLSESQAMFERFMANLPAGAFVHDPKARVSLFRNRWLESHFPQPDSWYVAETRPDPEMLETGPQLVQKQLPSRDGERVYCDTLRFPLPAPSERPLVGGIIMDVTERVLAEQDLAENRARLRTLLDTIPDLVWLKDPNGVYLACNARFEHLFGAKEAEIIGRRDHDFVDPKLAEFFREKDRIAMAAGEPTTNEETVTFANDGHRELLETTKAPVRDENGTLIGVLGIARDITRHRASEDNLRASKESLQRAESIAHIGNWEYRPGRNTLHCSDEAYRIFGITPGELYPDTEWLQSQAHADDRDSFEQYLKNLSNSRHGDDIPEFRFRILRSDGKPRYLSIWSRVEYGAQGKPVRLFGTVQDLSDSHQMHRDLTARLEELTRWQGVMLGREDRVQELKREINELLTDQGQPARYPSQGENR